MSDLNAEIDRLYHYGMKRVRFWYDRFDDELHPDGKPLMQTEITPELLASLSPQARQLLAQRHPQEFLRAMTGVV